MKGEARDDERRRAFAAPAARGTFDGMELALLDPADEDDRGLLIRAEHPEVAEAIDRGAEELEIDGHEMNPRLHLAIYYRPGHQRVENGTRATVTRPACWPGRSRCAPPSPSRGR